MKKLKMALAFCAGFVLGFGIFILGGMLDLFLHPWVREAQWNWLHLFSRHGLGIAWNSGVIWPHLFLSILSGMLGIWFYKENR